MKNRNALFLVIVFLLNLIIIYIFKRIIYNEDLVYNFYSEKLMRVQIEKIIEKQQKWNWVGYAIVPLLILIRTSLVAFCLSVGMFFYDMENEIPFKQFFRIALVGEFVLVLVGFFKFIYFYFVKTDYTLQDLQQYYPFSYINFLEIKNLKPWLIYPLQTINLFEIAYFFVLVYGLWKVLDNKYWKSLEITAVSYGTGLVIWLGLVMFLTLNYT